MDLQQPDSEEESDQDPEIGLEPDDEPDVIEAGSGSAAEEPDTSKQKTSKRSSLPVVARRELPQTLDPLTQYLNEIRRYTLLTPEEERQLAVEYQETKDPANAYRLTTANLRLVVKIAFEFSGYTSNILDLVQEGNVGLMQAVKHFDPLRGVRLSSYARYWIRSYIIYYLLNNYRLVKLGTTQAQRKLFFNLQRERARLSAMGIDPSPKMLAEKFDVPRKTVTEMIERMDTPEFSLDASRGDTKATLADYIPSGGTPEGEVSDEEMRKLFNRKIEKFGQTITSERELIIWRERLLAGNPITLQDLGDRFGVSRERARQLEAKLKGKLKSFLIAEIGDSNINLDFLGQKPT